MYIFVKTDEHSKSRAPLTPLHMTPPVLPRLRGGCGAVRHAHHHRLAAPHRGVAPPLPLLRGQSGPGIKLHNLPCCVFVETINIVLIDKYFVSTFLIVQCPPLFVRKRRTKHFRGLNFTLSKFTQINILCCLQLDKVIYYRKCASKVETRINFQPRTQENG